MGGSLMWTLSSLRHSEPFIQALCLLPCGAGRLFSSLFVNEVCMSTPRIFGSLRSMSLLMVAESSVWMIINRLSGYLSLRSARYSISDTTSTSACRASSPMAGVPNVATWRLCQPSPRRIGRARRMTIERRLFLPQGRQAPAFRAGVCPRAVAGAPRFWVPDHLTGATLLEVGIDRLRRAAKAEYHQYPGRTSERTGRSYRGVSAEAGACTAPGPHDCRSQQNKDKKGHRK
eukprot:scaffold526221_cov39-Prasinocladus_malaysianus.AAC.1